MVVQAGDAVLMDTRVMHCGGNNRSASDRMLMHFSFQTDKSAVQLPFFLNDDGEETSVGGPPKGFTYHLRPELKGKHKTSEFLGCTA
jgi:ectoine hydroxylase-related dioxygenase (phytanoyl-CoA dioxygenase family)